MGSAQLFSLLRGPNHVFGSVGNRIENITGNMAGALLSLHQLDLRTLRSILTVLYSLSRIIIIFESSVKKKVNPLYPQFFKRNPAAPESRNPVKVVGFEPRTAASAVWCAANYGQHTFLWRCIQLLK